MLEVVATTPSNPLGACKLVTVDMSPRLWRQELSLSIAPHGSRATLFYTLMSREFPRRTALLGLAKSEIGQASCELRAASCELRAGKIENQPPCNPRLRAVGFSFCILTSNSPRFPPPFLPESALSSP